MELGTFDIIIDTVLTICSLCCYNIALHHNLFQLILLMALAKGKSRVLSGALTLHTETAIWVAQQLTQVDINFNHAMPFRQYIKIII